MRPANPDRGVTCPYGKPGTAWATGEHGGVDYGCPTGDPVYAMWAGTVTGNTWGSAYGTQLVIDHDVLPDGSPGLWAVYAHLSSKTVSAGQRVKAGQQIGKSGATGNVSGPHLHVEVQRAASWQSGNYVNPQPWIDAEGDTMSAFTYKYLGKPGGTLTVGTSYVDLDQSTYDPPHDGWENTLIYLNVTPTQWADDATIGAIRVRIIRADGDATAYNDLIIARDALDDGSALHTYTYWELGDGKPTHVQLRCQGGLRAATIGTRYVKKATVAD